MQTERQHGAWYLRLLGDARLFDSDGAEVKLPTRRTLFALIALALADSRGISRRRLAEDIWPEANESNARASLRTALNHLRNRLPSGAIVDSGVSLCLTTGWLEVEDLAEGDPDEFLKGLDAEWAGVHRAHLIDRGLTIGAHTSRPLIQLRNASSTRDETPTEPSANEPVHPLVAAADWLLMQKPSEAYGMMLATQEGWFTVRLSAAVDTVSRVLQAVPASSPGYVLLEAQLLCLKSLCADSRHVLAKGPGIYTRARLAGEPRARMVAACAVSMASLFAGKPNQAAKILRGELDQLSSADIESRIWLSHAYAYVLVLVGQGVQAHQILTNANREARDAGLFGMAALCHLHAIPHAIEVGELDALSTWVDEAEHIFTKGRNDRLRPWAGLSRARVLEAQGNYDGAAEQLKVLRRSEVPFTVASQAEDLQLRISTAQGEWDDATQAWANGLVARKRAGVVPTPFDHHVTRAPKVALSDRVDREALRAAAARFKLNPSKTGPFSGWVTAGA